MPAKQVACLLFFLFFEVCALYPSELRMPSVFGDNMVLQRNKELVFWGNAAPLSEVTVGLLGQSWVCRADSDGSWKLTVTLTAESREPFDVKVQAGRESLVFHNVLLGEVWLASGQSNMEYSMSGVEDARNEIDRANYPEIRFFNVATNVSNYPLDDVRGKWEICSPATVARLSGVAYYFARQVLEKQHVPVGIISSSWGSTPVEAWTSREMLKIHPDFSREIETIEADTTADWAKEYADYQQAWNAVRNSNRGLTVSAHTPGYDDSSWKEVRYPMDVWGMGLGYFGGFFWIRKQFTLDRVPGTDVFLSLGTVYGAADVYLNGKYVGSHNNHLSETKFTVKKKLLKKGSNCIAVRLCSFWGTGKIGASGQSVAVVDASDKTIFQLDNGWKMSADIDEKFPSFPPYKSKPGTLYNAMIHPFRHYSMKGIIWYQGENNAARALQYRQIFPMLIYDWRINFAQGNLPFLYVQLANYRKPESFKFDDEWAYLRDAQLHTLKVSNTGMATIIDVGSVSEIHPRNKRTVGARLYDQAAYLVYGEKNIATGPLLKDYEVKGNEVVIHVSNPNSVLRTSDGRSPRGFYIAGENRQFYPADKVTISHNVIILSSARVAQPVSVRYAWASNPICNVCNREGTPLSPFRLDNW